jgi:small GTP-binding protein
MKSDEFATGISLDYIALQSELIHTAADLARLATLASASDEDSEAAKATDRLNHLASGTFVVALIGQFKRGKSTLANALLGADIMPADVEPATATINRVVYGRVPRATMCMHDGSKLPVPIDSLAQYVTKLSEASSAVAATIDEATIEYPARLCLNNVQLLDTPGLDDVDTAMTERTTAVLSRIDAAVLVTSALAPLGSTELEVLADLARHVDVSRVFVVVNQVDLLEASDHARVLEFVARRAAGALGKVGQPVFMVSGREALRAKQTKDETRLAASGFLALEDALETFLVRDSGMARVQAANETLERLALAQLERAEKKLATLQETDAASQARLAELEAGLDSVVQRIAEWPERAEARCAAQASEVDDEAKKLQERITAYALSALSGVTFTSADVGDNAHRHAKLRAHINPGVDQRFIEFIDADADNLRKLLIELGHDLARLSDQWDAALGKGIINDHSGRFDSVSSSIVSEITENVETEIEKYLASRQKFSNAYQSQCDLLILEVLIGRFFQKMRDEMVTTLAAKYMNHLPSVVGHAFAGSSREYLRTQAVKEVFKALLERLAALADRSNRSLDERKWILRLEREKVDKERVRAEERVLAVLSGAKEIVKKASARRIALRRILSDLSESEI